MTHPTPYGDLNAVLRELVGGIRSVLGANFLAAYLQGSFAVGGFDRDSDVDFLVAIHEELSREQVEALQALHGRVYELESAWAQHLEGSYFPKDVLRTCTRRGLPLWYLDNGSRGLIRDPHCNTAVVRWTVREHGVPLAGPEAATLMDRVPPDVLRREILKTMLGWGEQILADPARIDNHFYQTFAVLSYCRMLHNLHTGTIGSKRAGAEWVKANVDLDPAWPALIDRTWAGRPVPEVTSRTPADPGDLQLTLAFVRYIMDAGRRYAAAIGLDEKDVLLRDLVPEDLPVFFEHQRDPEAAGMAAFPSRDRDAFMAHWQKRILSNDAVIKKTIVYGDQVAGNLVCFEQGGQVQVGYWLGKEYWGKGIATRALDAFLSYVPARPLYAHVAKHNVASLRVLQKCGFVIAGEHLDEGPGGAVEEFVLLLAAP